MLHHLLLLCSLLWHHLHACRHVSGDHHLRLVLHLVLWGHLGHRKRLFKHVDIAWVLHVVEEDAHLGFTDALRLQKVLH